MARIGERRMAIPSCPLERGRVQITTASLARDSDMETVMPAKPQTRHSHCGRANSRPPHGFFTPGVSTRVGDDPRGRQACGGWWVADLEGHRGLQRMFQDLDRNQVHRKNPALWTLDTSPKGFQPQGIPVDQH